MGAAKNRGGGQKGEGIPGEVGMPSVSNEHRGWRPPEENGGPGRSQCSLNYGKRNAVPALYIQESIQVQEKS
jgi:hypothetical protein